MFRHLSYGLILVVLLGHAPAFARVLVVDNDGAECPQAEYITIQQAVAAAQAGDKILVCPGTYEGTVVVGTPDLRIEAQAGPGEVVLQGTGVEGELGFVLLNTTGVVLQGFTVERFGRAQIRIQGGGGNTVRMNVTRLATVNDGIQVNDSSANLVEHNTSHGNRQDGIFIGFIDEAPPPVLAAAILPEPASENIIRHNETFGNRFGINLFRSGTGNVLFGNRSHDNVQRGLINQGLSHGTVIEYNHVVANGLTGISVVNSSGVTVRGNKAEGNGASGIALNAVTKNVVTNNQSDGNGVAGGGAGVQLNNATNNSLVEKNQLSGNQDGIRLFADAATNTVQSNHIRQSTRDGIRAEVTTLENTIERNVIHESAEHDAHDDSVGSGTAGTANFWIRNHCDTENQLALCDH